MLCKGLQAVVMAGGRGSRMPEISTGKPKCLLSVGNKPLIWYPLQMLEHAGFSEVIIIILENQKVEIQKAIEKTDIRLKIDYVSISSNEDLGTVDSLRLLTDKISGDFIVISSDFITDINLNTIVNVFRKHNASIVSLLHDTEHLKSVSPPGSKSKHKPERDIIGIDNKTNRLVFLASSSDFDDEIQLTKRLLRKHNDMTLYSRLLDCHLFVMKQWILEYIHHEKSFTTIKGELIPHIVKKQLSKIPKLPENDKNVSLVNVELRNDIFQFAKEDDLEEKVKATSTYNDHIGDMKPVYHGDIIKCYAYLANNSSFGIRVNTLQAFSTANSLISEKWDSITHGKQLNKIHPEAEIKTKQIDEESMVGEGSKLNEKTSIKSSFIGSNCVVENKVRISNCILMNGVTIAEGCILQNCILCDAAEIETGVELKDCLVGSRHTVTADSKYFNEVLTAVDRLMEI